MFTGGAARMQIGLRDPCSLTVERRRVRHFEY